MWLMTSFGVLMPAVRPPETVAPDDPMTMQVRVRLPEHLDYVRDRMGDKLGPTISTPKFDYQARAYCRPEDFAAFMAEEITAIDYTKFKPTVHRFKKTDHFLASFYLSVWGVFMRMTPGKHGSGGGWSNEDVYKAAGHRGFKLPERPVWKGLPLGGPSIPTGWGLAFSDAELRAAGLSRAELDAGPTLDEILEECGMVGDDLPVEDGPEDLSLSQVMDVIGLSKTIQRRKFRRFVTNHRHWKHRRAQDGSFIFSSNDLQQLSEDYSEYLSNNVG
jgi:hypothetical protein